MIQDFQVSVTPIGERQYLVRTERVSSGVPLAEEQLSWPVDGWLRQARHLMTDPLLGLLANPVFTRDGEPFDAGYSSGLLQLGHQLYQALFTKSLRDSWVTAQGIAHHRGELLRLRLGLKGDELLALPWEVMNDGDRASKGAIFQVATGANIMFSRYQAGVLMSLRTQDRMLSNGQPLRMLVVTSAPDDQEQMALRREVEYLQQELRGTMFQTTENPPDLELTLLDQPDRTQLTQALEQGRYQILHYAGHSNLSDRGGDLHLVNRETGLTESLSGRDLAGLLVNNGVRLVVLNSCHGAQQSSDDGTAANHNLAEAIVQRGVPAVLAMVERIPDNVALTLTQLFYRNIRQGYAIDLSLSRARQGLMVAHGSDHLYWALPVLYLHPEDDGCLFASDRSRRSSVADLFTEDESVLPDFSMQTDISPVPWTRSLDNKPGSEQSLDDEHDRPIADITAEDHAVERSLETDELLLDDLPAEGTAEQIATLYEELSGEQQSTAPNDESKVAREETPDDQLQGSTALELSDTPDVEKPSTGGANNRLSTARSAVFERHAPIFWSAKWQPIVIGMAVAAIAFGGIRWALQSQNPDPPLPIPRLTDDADQEPPEPPPMDEDTGAAIRALQSGDLEQAELLLTQFLENGNLAEFDSVLETIPNNYLEDPAIHFLRGRFVWQSMQDEEQANDFNTASARTLWDAAIAAQPENAEYLNALGFSYAVDGQWLEALDYWLQALEVQEQEPIAQFESDGWVDVVDATEMSLEGLAGNRQVLTTYAGLSMALWALSEQGPVIEPDQARQLAIALQEAVQQQSPADFQLNSLQTNWLWTDDLIEQWQAIQP